MSYYVLPTLYILALCTGFIWAGSSTATNQEAASALWQPAHFRLLSLLAGSTPSPSPARFQLTPGIQTLCPVLLGV